jgi:hypothetical protein
MRRYRNSAGTPTRTDYGIGLVAGLQAFPETAPLAPPFEQLNDDLDQAYNARSSARKPLVAARVGLRFANYRVDQTIRILNGAAQIADGGRRGPVTADLFPEGLTPVIAPKGAGQIKPTEELLGRLTQSKLPGVIALTGEWIPRIEAGLATLVAADTAHQNANKAYLAAFKVEIAFRNEHARQVDRLMGLVRAAFPNDKTTQDIVFPEIEAESIAASEEEAEPPAEAPAEPPPAPEAPA